jgi:hypothetical protein
MDLAGVCYLVNSVAAPIVALALIAAPHTKAADCASAETRYKAAVGSVVEALRKFEGCIAASNKRDDCTKEFEALDSAHDDIVDAVEDLKTCP